MRYTWAFMWLGCFGADWCSALLVLKESSIRYLAGSGQYAIFAIALVTVILTAFADFRLMGMPFPQQRKKLNPTWKWKTHETNRDTNMSKPSLTMLVPYGILAG
jgi:NADH:ubiquinone oxidoreductase subunit 5 (subunit L)/multisubunit Na+/H+ antiporter MnhA subunit